MNTITVLAQAQPKPSIGSVGLGYELPVLVTVIVGMIAITSSIVKLTAFIKDLDKDLKLTSMDAAGQRNIILEKIVSSRNENSLKFESLEDRLSDLNSRMRRLENLPESKDKN